MNTRYTVVHLSIEFACGRVILLLFCGSPFSPSAKRENHKRVPSSRTRTKRGNGRAKSHSYQITSQLVTVLVGWFRGGLRPPQPPLANVPLNGYVSCTQTGDRTVHVPHSGESQKRWVSRPRIAGTYSLFAWEREHLARVSAMEGRTPALPGVRVTPGVNSFAATFDKTPPCS